MEYKVNMGEEADLKPLRVGEAAAVGKRLLGIDKWLRVDSTGRAEITQVGAQTDIRNTEKQPYLL